MIIHVKVKVLALKDRIEKIDNLNYIAFVKARPIDNKTNLTLIKLFAKEFRFPSKNILIKNLTSRKKIIEIKSK